MIGKAASVQFATEMPFRVIRVHDWPTYDGWVWLDGYELSRTTGDAVERRSIFVQINGIRPIQVAAPPRAGHTNMRPVTSPPKTGNGVGRRTTGTASAYHRPAGLGHRTR